MSGRHRFRPNITDQLETRCVLTHGIALGAGVGVAPVAVAPLNLSARAKSLTQSVTNSVNQIFDSFTADYLQAQGAYFASSAQAGNSAKTYFRAYVTQRLSLMSQQLVNTFTHVPGSLNMLPGTGPGGSAALQVYLRRYITGPVPTSLETALAGSRRNDPIPPASTSGTTATLYTTQALAAIETARSATLNSVSFLINHTFRAGHR